MKIRRSVIGVLAAALLVAAQLATTGPAQADHSLIDGYVTDATTGIPINDVCVTLGPPIACFTRTNAEGYYKIDLAALAARDGDTWDMWFVKTGQYQNAYSDTFVVDGPVRFNQVLMPIGTRVLCPVADTRLPTQTVYLPNVTKTLGGATGWQTPFIVQNTGTATASLEVSYYRFLNGACAVRRTVSNLRPGTSFSDVPNNDHDLPGDTQFSVVVKSFGVGSDIVSVVNQHAGSGSRAEALSYVGVSEGDTSVFLPNITRRFFGYVTPFIIQNLGTSEATATARFVSFDGSAPTITVTRDIPVGGSKFVDPNTTTGLVDGKQYSVTVSANRPVSVVVNTHNDAATVAAPVAYSTNGITVGADTVYGPLAAKNGAGVADVTTIVVQNLSTAAIEPTLTFDVLSGTGTTQTISAPDPIPAGQSWAFDPRFTVGTTTPCTVPSSTCLGDGEYSFVASAPGAEMAVAVNVISDTTAMGYTGITAPANTIYLPNVTRNLGGTSGWSTPILLQTIGASGATLKWYRFSDGVLVLTQEVEVQRGRGIRIDPRTVSGLTDNTQYSVVIDGVGGSIAAIVVEVASGGDNAMIYEGFAVE